MFESEWAIFSSQQAFSDSIMSITQGVSTCVGDVGAVDGGVGEDAMMTDHRSKVTGHR